MRTSLRPETVQGALAWSVTGWGLERPTGMMALPPTSYVTQSVGLCLLNPLSPFCEWR